MHRRTKERAFTLVEVVIASTLFLFVLGIVVGYQVYIRKGLESQRKGLFMSTATLFLSQLHRDCRSALRAECADGRVDLVYRGADGLETVSYSFRSEGASVVRESGMGKGRKSYDFSGWGDRGQTIDLSFEIVAEPSGSSKSKELQVKFRLREGDQIVDRLDKRLALEQLRPRRKLQWVRP